MRQLVGIIIVILVILGVWALVSSTRNQDQATENYADVARTWIEEESPTYNFDGSDLTLTNSQELGGGSYQHTFTFNSSQAGYGDRTGEVLAQVITPHTTVVRIENGRVVSAITDGVYDEMTEQMLSLPDGEDEGDTRTVQLFFYDEEADTDETGNIMCSADAVVAVTRDISDYTIEKHIQAVLDGPNQAEEDQGLSSEYPLEGFSLEGASLSEDGTLTLTFNDENNSASGGSCRVGILDAQIRKTAMSISGVEDVVMMPEDIFQP